MIKIKEIKFGYSENSQLLNKLYLTMKEADQAVFSATYGKNYNGTCDKTDFTITYDNCDTYNGSIDANTELPTLSEHLRQVKEFFRLATVEKYLWLTQLAINKKREFFINHQINPLSWDRN